MNLSFIRHGESRSNEQNLFAGRVDTPLTGLGLRQAAQARAQIERSGLLFDEVHVSPLSRARRTAEVILGESPRVEWIVADALVERDFGRLSEQNKSLIKKHFGAAEFESMFHSAHGRPPAGESFMAMYERVAHYHRTVLLPRANAGRRILVVAHKYIIEMFALLAAELPPEQYHDFKIPNSKPCSLADLRARVQDASPSLNHLAEEIEARLPTLILAAAGLGVGLKLVAGRDLPAPFFIALTVLLLGVNSGISLLRLETGVLGRAPTSLRRIWPGSLLRTALGVGLAFSGGNPLWAALGAFLLLPTAMTAPTLSLMWGGDYFLCIQSTLVMSVLSPIAVALTVAGGGLAYAHGAIHLAGFFGMLVGSVVLPGLLAQGYRLRRPIQAGAATTNWGWVGGAVLIPLALLSAYQMMPNAGVAVGLGAGTWIRAAGFAILLFVVARGLGKLAAAFAGPNHRLKTDVYINHLVPNIFFWFTLIPAEAAFAPVRILALLAFFGSIFLEEKARVSAFPKQAGLLVPVVRRARLRLPFQQDAVRAHRAR